MFYLSKAMESLAGYLYEVEPFRRLPPLNMCIIHAHFFSLSLLLP